MERLINGACRLLVNLLHFTMSITTQEQTFPGIFQSMTNGSDTKPTAPLPVLSNLENDVALFQTQDAKWVNAFEHIYMGKAQTPGSGPLVHPLSKLL